MFKKNKKDRQGIVALFPAIIISSILIILCVGLSRSFLAFLYRTTLFDQKIQGDVIAHTCSLRVLAKHNQNNHYAGGDSVSVGGVPCVVGVFATTTGSVSVKVGEAVSTENVSY